MFQEDTFFRPGDSRRWCKVRIACGGERLTPSTWAYLDAEQDIHRCIMCREALMKAGKLYKGGS